MTPEILDLAVRVGVLVLFGFSFWFNLRARQLHKLMTDMLRARRELFDA